MQKMNTKNPLNVLPAVTDPMPSSNDPSTMQFHALSAGPYAPCARAIAQTAHAGQKDKAGADYILHPCQVAAAFEGDDILQSIAWLHDVLEDTPWSADDLRQSGLPDLIVDAVEVLTKLPEEDYFAYIQRAADHPLARPVKIADLNHNRDLSRLPHPTPKDIQRAKRYQQALLILKQKVDGSSDLPDALDSAARTDAEEHD